MRPQPAYHSPTQGLHKSAKAQSKLQITSTVWINGRLIQGLSSTSLDSNKTLPFFYPQIIQFSILLPKIILTVTENSISFSCGKSHYSCISIEAE